MHCATFVFKSKVIRSFSVKKVLFLALACFAIFEVFPTPLTDQLKAWSKMKAEQLPTFDEGWLTNELAKDIAQSNVSADASQDDRIEGLPIIQAVDSLSRFKRHLPKQRFFWKVVESLLTYDGGEAVKKENLFGSDEEMRREAQMAFVLSIARLKDSENGDQQASKLLKLLIDQYRFGINAYNINKGGVKTNRLMEELTNFRCNRESLNPGLLRILLEQLDETIFDAVDKNGQTLLLKLLDPGSVCGGGPSCDVIAEFINNGKITRERMEKIPPQCLRRSMALALRYKNIKFLKACNDTGIGLGRIRLADWDAVRGDADFVGKLKEEFPKLVADLEEATKQAEIEAAEARKQLESTIAKMSMQSSDTATPKTLGKQKEEGLKAEEAPLKKEQVRQVKEEAHLKKAQAEQERQAKEEEARRKEEQDEQERQAQAEEDRRKEEDRLKAEEERQAKEKEEELRLSENNKASMAATKGGEAQDKQVEKSKRKDPQAVKELPKGQVQEPRLTEQRHQSHQQLQNADNTKTVQPQADGYNKLMIGWGALLSAVVLTSIIYSIAKKRKASEEHHRFSEK